ncbi:zinc finger protein GLI1 [Parasteatoda tepidariorum]|uniref:zinc finger protein GLI1 n=1 Tax=Parasteatoda tepidariorum TaxID=114398 RepID=UPI00077FC6E7|nr:zinc finger protein ZIC 4 [Parasteatoda tepidariorum]XP_015925637.1 zinc finger protein ZIC 4 [Parasteatoda tepidariorum]XP_015925638.1 zinc finger protein ZIC 4 [Parasteatoda tepidariorum]XP_015925639.1 zinc finger protein ZIC 4 [Parasteatoda tepidariorum]XP_042897274.1 zinc finger protein ZIC 4 [Parasteatoda tepidariorum]
MDQERCALISKDDIKKEKVHSTVIDDINGDCVDCDECGWENIYDITSSSLIKSPLISELLKSHGLLRNGHIENKDIYDYCDESELCPIDDSFGPPSFLRIYSFQPYLNNTTVDDDENEKGDYRCGWKDCDICFECRKDLAQHVNSTHVYQDENSLYRCQWSGCTRQGKAINARYRMLIHVRTHTHEKPHGCEFCGKKFSRLENLRIHIRSHTGEKPYACPVAGCTKAYSNSSDRFKHSKTHQEDKPYVCRVEGCDKRYTDPSSLRKHMKSNAHGGDSKQKPVASTVPGIQNGVVKNSNNVNDTGSSLKISTPKKILYQPYACKTEGCNKRYTDPSSLRKHQRATSHGRDPNTWKPKMGSKATQNKGNVLKSQVHNGASKETTNVSTKEIYDPYVLETTTTQKKDGNDPTPLDLSISYTSSDECCLQLALEQKKLNS